MDEFKKYLEMAASNRIIVILTLIFVYPVGALLMWKGQHFTKNIRWIVSGILVVWTMMLMSGSDSGYQDPYGSSSGCAEVIQSGSCTYYRDSSCQVIATECS